MDYLGFAKCNPFVINQADSKPFLIMKSLAYLALPLILVTFAIDSRGQSPKVLEYVQNGVERHDLRDYSGAISQYELALKEDKKSPLVHYEMSSTYFAMKNY
jgi:hypothetical protein